MGFWDFFDFFAFFFANGMCELQNKIQTTDSVTLICSAARDKKQLKKL
jgi:hypothetical protein